MAKIVDLHEAGIHLESLVAEAASGHEISIAMSGRPIARLVPLAPATMAKTLGLLQGKLEVPDDLDAPLDRESLERFEGS